MLLRSFVRICVPSSHTRVLRADVCTQGVNVLPLQRMFVRAVSTVTSNVRERIPLDDGERDMVFDHFRLEQVQTRALGP